jgi:hypothetical protein
VRHAIPTLIFLLFLWAIPAFPQSSSGSFPPAGAIHDQHPESVEEGTTVHMHQRQLSDLNRQRQQQMKRDTDKLFQLATELKQSVDKTNENILSIEVIRKTEEIEKLAKSVREKMKANYTDVQ